MTISGGTSNTKVDLSADYNTILQMAEDGTTALYVENNNGVFTCYAVGEAPTMALSVYATISEVTPPPRSLTGTTWLFNNEPTLLEMPYPISISFTSNGYEWTGMTRNDGGTAMKYTSAGAGDTTAYSGVVKAWTSQPFKMVVFHSEPDNTAFITWLQANATQQS